jgi:hypothetical protein
MFDNEFVAINWLKMFENLVDGASKKLSLARKFSFTHLVAPLPRRGKTMEQRTPGSPHQPSAQNKAKQDARYVIII